MSRRATRWRGINGGQGKFFFSSLPFAFRIPSHPVIRSRHAMRQFTYPDAYTVLHPFHCRRQAFSRPSSSNSLLSSFCLFFLIPSRSPVFLRIQVGSSMLPQFYLPYVENCCETDVAFRIHLWLGMTVHNPWVSTANFNSSLFQPVIERGISFCGIERTVTSSM